jgi:hypothetical protein
MLTPMRARKGALIGAVAACAAIGATSPVWAGTGSSPSPAPAAGQTTSADAATIAALQAQISQLKTTLNTDEVALNKAVQADLAAARATHNAQQTADRWKLKSERTKTRTVTVDVPGTMNDPTTSTDPATANPCHHNGTDPGNWRGHGDGNGQGSGDGSNTHHFHFHGGHSSTFQH